NQSALIANRSAIRTLQELDHIAAESVARQVALRSEELEGKARLAKAEYESVALQQAMATQKEQLNDLLGRDIRTEFTVGALPEISMAAPDLAQARIRAL